MGIPVGPMGTTRIPREWQTYTELMGMFVISTKSLLVTLITLLVLFVPRAIVESIWFASLSITFNNWPVTIMLTYYFAR